MLLLSSTAILNNSVLNFSLPFFLFLFQSHLFESTPSLVILSQPPSHTRRGSPYVRRIWEELGVEAHLVEKHGCLREENRPYWKDPCLMQCVCAYWDVALKPLQTISYTPMSTHEWIAVVKIFVDQLNTVIWPSAVQYLCFLLDRTWGTAAGSGSHFLLCDWGSFSINLHHTDQKKPKIVSRKKKDNCPIWYDLVALSGASWQTILYQLVIPIKKWSGWFL